MRFDGEREVPAPVARVWAGLHDSEVLGRAIPGCEDLVPLGGGRYAATLRARVGPVNDTYRGSFAIEDPRPGSETLVIVDADGRCGRLEVCLRVLLAPGSGRGSTVLRYHADATVLGFVSRLGAAPLAVAGGHFTACFFRDLDRALRAHSRSEGPLDPFVRAPQASAAGSATLGATAR